LVDAACAGPDEPASLCDHILARLTEPGEHYDDVTAVVARLSGA